MVTKPYKFCIYHKSNPCITKKPTLANCRGGRSSSSPPSRAACEAIAEAQRRVRDRAGVMVTQIINWYTNIGSRTKTLRLAVALISCLLWR
jgi:hypothetical protein